MLDCPSPFASCTRPSNEAVLAQGSLGAGWVPDDFFGHPLTDGVNISNFRPNVMHRDDQGNEMTAKGKKIADDGYWQPFSSAFGISSANSQTPEKSVGVGFTGARLRV